MKYFHIFKPIGLFFKKYYYFRKDRKVVIFFIDLLSKNIRIPNELNKNIISHIIEPKFNKIFINEIF